MDAMRPATLKDMPRLQEIVEEVWAIGSDFALEELYGSDPLHRRRRGVPGPGSGRQAA